MRVAHHPDVRRLRRREDERRQAASDDGRHGRAQRRAPLCAEPREPDHSSITAVSISTTWAPVKNLCTLHEIKMCFDRRIGLLAYLVVEFLLVMFLHDYEHVEQRANSNLVGRDANRVETSAPQIMRWKTGVQLVGQVKHRLEPAVRRLHRTEIAHHAVDGDVDLRLQSLVGRLFGRRSELANTPAPGSSPVRCPNRRANAQGAPTPTDRPRRSPWTALSPESKRQQVGRWIMRARLF